MAQNTNRIVITGNLTRDPELKSYGDAEDQVLCGFGVAVNRRPKQGQSESEVDFFNVTAFNGMARVIAQTQRKGKKVLVAGRMQSRKVEKDDTTVVYWDLIAESVEFLSPKDSDSAPAEAQEPAPF